ncbi:hypothetical protein HELRODRAFT_179374 [Helobdella robusta]|uniref:PH domain-containing protein n=1 Tax=Helobdella robusta TaxID=6412 RepID=T1FEM4_HELRO|nr:hypothetical protein HELRODRAFT_179374 [Helobdella robusta]ESN95597.1 hypothetical protein HELRODRAFT_179374 [Helobdella robusta]
MHRHPMCIPSVSNSSPVTKKSSISQPTLRTSVMEEGGKFAMADIKGFTKIEGKGRRFAACKNGKLALYNNKHEFSIYSPIHIIDLQLCNVRSHGKHRLQLTLPQNAFIFQFDTTDETNDWKTAIENGISMSLGDDEVRESVHRKMVNAKVRSMRMDSKVWSEHLIKIMIEVGNRNFNSIWEHKLHKKHHNVNLIKKDYDDDDDYGQKDDDDDDDEGHDDNEDERINSDTDTAKRINFIQKKYIERAFFKTLDVPDTKKLNTLLESNLKTDDVLKTLHLIYSGANSHETYDRIENDHLTDSVHALQMELLKLNMNKDRKSFSSI